MGGSIKTISLLLALFMSSQIVAHNPQLNSLPQLRNGWKRVTPHQSFSFALPKDMKQQKARGIDSFVGRYKNNRALVTFDYGRYSNEPSIYTSEPEYRRLSRAISGTEAKIIYFRETNPASDYRYIAAVYFPELKSDVKLSVAVYFNEEAYWDTALAIFDSIQLK